MDSGISFTNSYLMFSGKPLVPLHIARLDPYVAGKSIEEVERIYRPDRISKLASNENRLGCSSNVKQAVIEALDQTHNYPDPVGTQLREQIAKRNRVDSDEVILAAGSESIISLICRTFFLNHENAVTADVTFVGFFVQAGVRGIELKKVPVTENYKYDVDGILAAVDGQTRLVYIANPNNPTGTYVSRDEFVRLQNRLPDNVLLVTDEAYFEYACDVADYPHALKHRKRNLIVLRTFSKAYGLAGMRIGYAIADRRLIRELLKTKLTFEPAAVSQAAARAAYLDQEFLENSVDIVRKGRIRLYNFFDSKGIRYSRSIANSVMMILKNEYEAQSFTQKMLEQGVILRRVHSFGMPQAIRITIGREEEMDHFESAFNHISSK